MTWMSHAEVGMNGNLLEVTHWTQDCGALEHMGSARWYLARIGDEKHKERTVIWPPLKSPAREKMAEFAIANAALLGAQFVRLPADQEEAGWPGGSWGIENYRMAVGWHEDQAEAACAFLSMKGYWVCFDKQKQEWELARI